MQKGFARILVVVLFLVGLVSVGAYYLEAQRKFNLVSIASPTPTTSKVSNSDLVNWKTYTNSAYGFRLKYPESWKYKPVSQLPDTVFFSPDEIVFVEGAEFPPVPIFVSVKKENNA